MLEYGELLVGSDREAYHPDAFQRRYELFFERILIGKDDLLQDCVKVVEGEIGYLLAVTELDVGNPFPLEEPELAVVGNDPQAQLLGLYVP